MSMTVAVSSQPPIANEPSLTGFLGLLFTELDARGIQYCVLHSFENLPDGLATDLDMAIPRRAWARIPDVLSMLEAHGYHAVQCLNYEIGGYYFVFAWSTDSSVQTVAIDFISEHREGNLILASGEELVRGRRRFRSFWIPAAAQEYRYLLIKKVLKGAMTERSSRRLADLSREIESSERSKICAQFFGKNWGERAIEASAAGTLGEILLKLKHRVWARTWQSRPWMPLWYRLSDLPRIARRVAEPTGLLVAVLGPDGVGKSTLLRTLGEQLAGAFRSRSLFHWRPAMIFAGRSSAVTNPHERPVFGALRSLAHLAGHFADYQIGFALCIQPMLSRSGLVLFDRYFYDLAADPKRYRYGGPPAVPKMLFRAVPRPDLVLLLDAPEEVVLGRKSETTAEEIRAGRERYWSLAEQDLPIRRLDASQSPDLVALRASKLVIEALRARFAERHSEWVMPSKATVLDQTAAILGAGAKEGGERRYAVLPSTSDPRFLIPVSSQTKNSVDRLSIYSPYSAKARVMKVALSSAMRLPSSLWARETISLPPGPLEDLVRKVFGESSPDLAISLGTPNLYRKATVQISVGRRVIGFLKVPLTPAADQRLEHEASVLAHLSTFPAMRAFLPSVLYASKWNDRFVLIQSPLDGRAGSLKFGEEHRDFLHALSRVSSMQRKAQELLDETARKWEPVAHVLNVDARRAVARSLRVIEHHYASLKIPCGFSHGDFAPWNTRQRPENLGVFDWEAAATGRPHDWDAFHFQTQTASLLGRYTGYHVDADAPETDCSHWIYLIHSLSVLLAEQREGLKDLGHRIQRIKDRLEAT